MDTWAAERRAAYKVPSLALNRGRPCIGGHHLQSTGPSEDTILAAIVSSLLGGILRASFVEDASCVAQI